MERGALGPARGAGRTVYRFGAFTLLSAERRLEQDGEAVRIGARAFDILLLLIERAGEPVSKREITDRAWPDVTVGESSLRFQIVALRRLLGDDRDDGGMITTLAGRGYCFVAPVLRDGEREFVPVVPTASALPSRLMRMVGRSDAVTHVADVLMRHRFVTLVGAGGIGKTTIAVAVAHEVAARITGRVHFVDLSTANTPVLAVGMLAHALGLPVNVDDPSPVIATSLRGQSALLVLDSCEHVVDAIAALAELVFASAPEVHILATSREALRSEGEHIVSIEPLAYPAEDAMPDPSELLTYPAAELLIERAAAAGSSLVVDLETAPLIAEICREVDGIALALEITAGRIPSYGLRGTLSLLEDRNRFLIGGRRTAVPRHRALSETLSWSYDLLEPDVRTVFQRLAVLVGDFDLGAAVAVAADARLDRSLVIDAVGSLASKSLVAVRQSGDGVFYRLLDTTRAYAFGLLTLSGEMEATAGRHARHFAGVVAAVPPRHMAGTFTPNLRSALEWCFGSGGDGETGIALAIGACPLLLERSLLTDCVRFSRTALESMPEQLRQSQGEMILLSCLGQALMFTSGNVPEAGDALGGGLALAEAYQDQARCLRLCGALHIFHERTGDYHQALCFARRGQEIAEAIGDPAAIAAGHSLLGVAYHLIGDYAATDRHLEHALSSDQSAPTVDPTGFGFDHRNRARITMARSHFLQGRPATAELVMQEAITEALGLEHPVTYAIALIWAGEIATWREHWGAVEEIAARLQVHSERHLLRPYPAISMGARGIAAIHRGRPEPGVRMLADAISAMRAMRYELVNTVAEYHLADGLRLQGRLREALTAIEEVEARISRQGDALHLPEVLRIKGLILSSSSATIGSAMEILNRSLEYSRSQGAKFWTLRTAVTMVRLGYVVGYEANALDVLRREYENYEEKADTADLVSARALLGL